MAVKVHWFIGDVIFVGVDTAELELGDNLKINLNLNQQTNQDITYLVSDVLLNLCCYVPVFVTSHVFCRKPTPDKLI